VHVTGEVYDSLLGAPLAGALVSRAGAPGVTVTDSAGRFALGGVAAGPGAFVFSHPALDSVGLADVVVPADLSGARDTASTRLATPSRATLWARACPDLPRPSPDAAGVLAGTVRDADTGAPVPGGGVTVAWTAVDTVKGRLAGRPRVRPVRADAAGGFRLCGVPTGVALEVQGAAERTTSGWALVGVGPRGLASVDLLVPPPAPPAAVGDTARRALTVAAAGVVRDSLGAPRGGARVTLDGAPGVEAVTGPDGRFRLANVPAGTQTFVVRALGYAPQAVTVGLRARDPEPVEITLRRVVRLALVEVNASLRRPNAWLRDNLARRRRLLGPGAFVDSTVLRRAFDLRGALTQVPFASVRRTGYGTWALTNMRGCQLGVALDGRMAEWDEVVDLPPARVLAVEVYRESQVPGEFYGLLRQVSPRGGSGAGCGIALVWTRAGQ
jgi:hypothetical protein